MVSLAPTQSSELRSTPAFMDLNVTPTSSLACRCGRVAPPAKPSVRSRCGYVTNNYADRLGFRLFERRQQRHYPESSVDVNQSPPPIFDAPFVSSPSTSSPHWTNYEIDALVADVVAATTFWPPRLQMPPPRSTTGIVTNEWSPTPSPPPFHPGVQSSITVNNILIQIVTPPTACQTENNDDDDCVLTGCTPAPAW